MAALLAEYGTDIEVPNAMRPPPCKIPLRNRIYTLELAIATLQPLSAVTTPDILQGLAGSRRVSLWRFPPVTI
jgi:hypothetical protein